MVAKPLKLAFYDKKLIVLTHDQHNPRHQNTYSIFTYNIPSDEMQGFQPAPNIRQFNASNAIPPSMASTGQIFYIGVGIDDGWIMHRNYNGEDERIVWCPLSWRSIGKFHY